MKWRRIVPWVCLAGFVLPPATLRGATPADPAGSNTIVRFEFQRGTNPLGRVEVELFDRDKPETVRNFLLYIRSGAYSNTFLHRCVPGFVVQGGGFGVTNPLSPSSFSDYREVTNYGRLTNEFLVGPRVGNTFGTIAMAKIGDDPNSATSQWFFNLGNNTTNLDNQNGGFAVFGRVLESTNADEGSNVLAHFNSLSSSAGIVNLGNRIGPAYQVFSDLPVAYTNSVFVTPSYNQLYYFQISVLNQTSQPGPIPPGIALLSPAPNSRFTNQVVTLRGTAGDDTGVARAVYRVQGGPLEIAGGTTNWVVNLAPLPGFNTVTLQSIDCDGHWSTNTLSATFFYVAHVPLDLQVTGSGRILGATNGQKLRLGSFYTLIARPASGRFFGGWSGSVTSASATLTFQVPTNATNFSLTAKFTPDPFTQLAGGYHGLIRASSPGLEDAGFLTLTLTTRGTFSGKILHRGGRYGYTGRFDRNGSAFVQGTLGGVTRSLSLTLDLTNAAGVITGPLSGGSGSAQVQLDRLASALPVTNPPPAGRYTFVLPATSASAPSSLVPGGNGFGAGKLSRSGTLQLAGTLGDGRTFTASARMSRARRWPLYVSFSSGRGALLGWLSNSTNDVRNLDGGLQWITSPNAKAARYRAGITDPQVACLVSAYTPPTGGVRVLNWVNGLSRVTGANLEIGITNLVKLTPGNILEVRTPNEPALSFKFDLKTGLMSGGFIHPWIGTTSTLRGVILKRDDSLRGLFVDGDQTGNLIVSAAPFLVTQSVANVTRDGLTAALSEGGLLRFEQDGVITLTGPLVPQFDTALDANGHDIVLSGGGVTRLIEVRTNLNFSAVGIKLANGLHRGADSASSQPGGDGCGAGILNLGGIVGLTNCVLTNFVVMGGSAGAETTAGRGLGAAICNRGGRLALQNCTLADNRAMGGSLPPSSTNFAGAALGGAVFSDGGIFVLDSSTLNDNLAQGGSTSGEGSGGAIHVAGGSMMATNSTLAFNRAAGGSGATGDGLRGVGRGGALTLVSNSAALVNLTLAYNRAEQGAPVNASNGAALGGGIASLGAGITLRGSIVASNAPVNFEGGLADGGYNFSSDGSLAFTSVSSRTNIDPLLGPLATNGGPTRTMSLLANSPARDVIPAGLLPPFDQRGVARPDGALGDSGAFEAVPPPSILTEPADVDVAPGATTNFVVIADGPDLAYAWSHDGLPIADATNATLVISNAMPGAQGGYRVVVTNSSGAVTSRVASLTFNSLALSILAQPQSVTNLEGQAAMFNVQVDGVPPFNFQWYFDNAVIPDATNSTLSFASVDRTNAGVYRVGVANAYAYLNSASAVLTVVSNLPGSLVRGPYLQSGSSHGGVVRWRSERFSDAVVRYGTNLANLDNAATEFAITNEHIVQLTGLEPDTRYFYSVGSSIQQLAGGTNDGGADFWFRTSPLPGTRKPTRLWVLGDSGTAGNGPADRQLITRTAYETYAGTNGPADLWLMLGDNAYNSGTDTEYQRAVFDIYPATLRNLFLWPTIGNHETSQSFTAVDFPYLEIFSLPKNAEAGGIPSGTGKYYSFDRANIHLICLDSMSSGRTTNTAMVQWLLNDLASTVQEWIIVFFHHPPYTKGSHDSDAETELIEIRENILPILEAHGVDLVLSGHSHSYERSFLLNGHYGLSSTLATEMKIDGGDGRVDGDGAYRKSGGIGTSYVVAGNSGQVSGGPLDHPAHFLSLNELGSLVIDVAGDRLDLVLLSTNAVVDDHFSIVKGHTPVNDPPIVTLISPTNNDFVLAPADVPLIATATDPDGIIALVEFFESGNRIGEATNSPYTLVWSNTPPGQYTFSATATDNDGLISTSAPVVLNVEAPSLLALGIPPALSIVVETTNLLITCRGTAGRVQHLQFAVEIGPGTSWITVATHTLPASGVFTWRRPLPTNGAAYYRVVSP